jgi:hypothetical protein
VIFTHDKVVLAVHAQPEFTTTLMTPLAPVLGAEIESGVTV